MNTFYKMAVSFTTVVALSGCSAGPMGILPPLKNNPAEAATITLIRSDSIIGSTNNYRITLDGENIFSIRYGQYTNFKINDGNYSIGVTCFGGWTPTPKREYVDIVVKQQQDLYLLIAPNFSCAGINIIDEYTAKTLISNSDYVSMEQ